MSQINAISEKFWDEAVTGLLFPGDFCQARDRDVLLGQVHTITDQRMLDIVDNYKGGEFVRDLAVYYSKCTELNRSLS